MAEAFRCAFAGAALITATLLALPAIAQTQQQIDWCNGNTGATPELQISSCTAVIESGRHEGKNLANAFNNRGLAYNKKGQYDRAIQDLDQAIQLNPQHALAFINRGLAYNNKGQYDRAIQDYDQAIRLNPQFAEAFGTRGNAYKDKGQYDRAIQDYDQAIRLNPQDAGAFNNRGLAYKDKGQYDRAIQDFDQVIRLNPQDAGAFNNRGVAYKDKGQYDRAIQDYDQVIRLNPQDAGAFNNRGLAYKDKGQYDRAIQDFDQVIRLDPQNAHAFNNRGITYYLAGNFDRALGDFEEAHRRFDPKSPYGLYGRGAAKLKKGDTASGNADIAAAKAIKADIAEVFARYHGIKPDGVLLVAGSALAQSLPNPTLQEILVKASLLTFNDANVTGNYTVLHAKLAKPFRDKFSPEQLKQTFKGFADKRIDFDLIAAKPIVPTAEAQINSNGVLMLRGYFDTTPSRVSYELDFLQSEGEWKLIDINVKVRPPGQ
jgi:tetratricopeptide (TPR) repeat protein